MLRDHRGLELDRRVETFAAREHRADFVDSLFPGLNPPFTGSLTFQVQTPGQRLAAITLRENINQHGEAIFATLAVADLQSPNSDSSLVFPHIGAGQGLSTQIILINAATVRAAGTIRFTASDVRLDVGWKPTSNLTSAKSLHKRKKQTWAGTPRKCLLALRCHLGLSGFLHLA